MDALFCKMSIVLNGNVMKYMLLTVRVNYIIYIKSLCRITKKPFT